MRRPAGATLRGSRPDIARALEAVVLRGLERDPARRWRSLEEFQAALVPFMPGGLSIAGIGRRVGAFALDLGLSYLVTWAIVGQAERLSQLRGVEITLPGPPDWVATLPLVAGAVFPLVLGLALADEPSRAPAADRVDAQVVGNPLTEGP